MTTNHQTSIASLAKKRRTYSAEFKQQIVQACKAPDVSIASVALQHGLNTNLVSKWIRLIDAKPGMIAHHYRINLHLLPYLALHH